MQLLDVGALDLNYKEKAVECTAIDLNPQKKGIVKADFLKFKVSKLLLFQIPLEAASRVTTAKVGLENQIIFCNFFS